MDKEKTVCFTGKRASLLPWKYDETDARCIKLKQALCDQIESAINEGYTHFISGMAQGIDLYACEQVLQLRKKYRHITLEAAIPYKGQADRWPRELRKRYYDEILPNCDAVHYVGDHYTSYCMLERNRYMVDKSNLLIAAYGYLGGGTKYTVEYAQRRGIQVQSLAI